MFSICLVYVSLYFQFALCIFFFAALCVINYDDKSSAVTRCLIFRLNTYTKFNFGWGCAPDPTGEPLAGWVGAGCPFSKNTHPALGPSGLDTAFSQTHHLSPQTKKSKCLCAQGRHVILSWIGTPHFLDRNQKCSTNLWSVATFNTHEL